MFMDGIPFTGSGGLPGSKSALSWAWYRTATVRERDKDAKNFEVEPKAFKRRGGRGFAQGNAKGKHFSAFLGENLRVLCVKILFDHRTSSPTPWATDLSPLPAARDSALIAATKDGNL
jgi:hypothetical protein